MIIVDESDPIDELEPTFPYRDVSIRRGVSIRDSYEILDEIGRGKFGRVYRCRDKATGLTLAAKVVSTKKKEEKRNVEREVEIMKTLQHPKCIQLFDAIEDVNRAETCLVLEMVGGGELFDRVIQDDFVLSERACAVFIRQICEALEYIHSKSIIHLDMKPENVMCLSKNGNRIKIIDFGLARFYDPKKKLQVLFGTPDFVSPECVSFEEITLAADLWSVGVITYVLLSGLSPFMGDTDVETMSNVTIGKYDFDDDAFDDISEDARDFISKLLVKNKSSRLMARECLKHRWLLPSSSSTASSCLSPVKSSSTNDLEKTSKLSNKTNSKDNNREINRSDKEREKAAASPDSGNESTSSDGLTPDIDINNASCTPKSRNLTSSSPVSSSTSTPTRSSSPPRPITTSTRPKISPKPTGKDLTLTIRKNSRDLAKDHLKQFVSNWTDNPYLFDSSREIISNVCSSTSSSTSSSSPSPPPPHYFDNLRRHSHKIAVVETALMPTPVGKTKSSTSAGTKSKFQHHPIILTPRPSSVATNAGKSSGIRNSTNAVSSTIRKTGGGTEKTGSATTTYECGVNIVSQIRRFSYQLHEELELIKTNGTAKTKSTNTAATTLRKCPVNVK